MAMDRTLGCEEPGTTGRAVHRGDPLTVDQIRELPDRAEVVITWSGGNGPWPYRILVDAARERRVENLYPDPILKWEDQRVPLHRVTLGWGDTERAWDASKVPEPAHIREEWRRLRGAA